MTLQIARTYAVQPGSQAAVTDALTRLITATDNNLSQQKDWIALLGFFEFLQVIDLSTNFSQLRRAALYQLLGEYQRSQDLLSALKDGDDRLDTEWTAALNLQWTKSAEHSSGNDLPAYAVAAGDVVVIPPEARQRIRNTGSIDLVFLAICSPPFSAEDYVDADD